MSYLSRKIAVCNAVSPTNEEEGKNDSYHHVRYRRIPDQGI